MTSKAPARAKTPKRPFFEGWTFRVVGTPRPRTPEQQRRIDALLLASVYDAAQAHPELFGENQEPSPSLWECEQILRRLGPDHGEHAEEPATLVAAGA